MPPKQNTQAPNVAMPFNPDELIALSERLRDFTTRLPAVGSPQLATPAGKEAVLLAASQQLSTLTLTVSGAAIHAQRNEQTALTTGLTRVASSFERMNTGMNTMLEAHKKMRDMGKWTAGSSFSYATGVLSLTAGAVSLFGGDGPNYNGALSEIHAEINALRREYRADLLRVAEALQNDIRTVGKMVAQVMVNQQIILNAVYQALDGLDQIKTLLTEHVQTTGATLTHIATKDLRKARFIIEQYLDGTGISPDKPVLTETLTELQRWLKTELKHPVINDEQLSRVSSERMVEILNQQSALNMPGLIASRLRFLFGNDIVDEKYTKLPSMEVFQSTAALFLLGAQKSQLFSADAWEAMCQDIQNTFKLYSEFTNSLKGNTRLWQALFDRYHHHRDRLGRMLWKAPKQIPDALVLDEMEELRSILAHVATWIGDQSDLAQRVSALDSKHHIIHFVQTGHRPLHAEKVVGPVDSYHRDLQWGIKALAKDTWTEEFTTPASLQHHPLQIAADKLYLNLTQHSPGETLFATGYKPEHRYALWLYQSTGTSYVRPYIPDPFSYIIRKTYERTGSYAGDYIAEQKSDYPYQVPSSQLNMPVLSLSTPAMMFMYLSAERKKPADIKEATYDRYLIEAILRAPGQGLVPPNTAGTSDYRREYRSFDAETHRSAAQESRDFNSLLHVTYVTKYFPPNSTFANRLPHGASINLYSFNPELPQDYRAFSSLNSDEIKTIQSLYKFYTLYASGYLKEAESFLTQHSFNQDYEKSYLLFMVAILGRWDIFEAFEKKYPLNGKYNEAIKGGSLTPLMLAAQHGREDVVKGILSNFASTSTLITTQSFDKKTAGQYALEQGFYKIAYLLKAGLTPQEIQLCKDKLPVDLLIATPSAPNPLAIALNMMVTEVERFKTEFKTQAEAKARAQAAIASAPAPVPAGTRAEESDSDGENDLEILTTLFFQKNHIAKPREKMWSKPSNPQDQATGKRMISNSFFQDSLQVRAFRGQLREHDFPFTPDFIDGEDRIVAFVKRPVSDGR
jgi:hypothetical protein